MRDARRSAGLLSAPASRREARPGHVQEPAHVHRVHWTPWWEGLARERPGEEQRGKWQIVAVERERRETQSTSGSWSFWIASFSRWSELLEHVYSRERLSEGFFKKKEV